MRGPAPDSGPILGCPHWQVNAHAGGGGATAATHGAADAAALAGAKAFVDSGFTSGLVPASVAQNLATARPARFYNPGTACTTLIPLPSYSPKKDERAIGQPSNCN